MQRLEQLETVPAFNYMARWQQQLVRLAFTLWQREKATESHLIDYSFVVFPMAKAYEGFLKDYLLDLELINKTAYQSRRFRIGRVLNPDIREKHQDELWVYDDVVAICGKDIARQIWEAWLTCRNRVFHYFPGEDERLTLGQSGRYLEQVFEVMQAAVTCSALEKEDREKGLLMLRRK